MSWLRIDHETSYFYSKPVDFGAHRLVLRPREGHDIRVEEMVLEIEPDFNLEWSRDVFGNSVASVNFLSSADSMRIRSRVLLRQTAPFPAFNPRPTRPSRYPPAYSPLEDVVAGAYRSSTFPEDLAAVKAWARAVVDPSAHETAESVAMALNAEVKRTIGYARREVKGVQTPTETLQLRTGSCRDLATLLLEGLRVLGFPARFASGYLDCRASEAGRASTHAWAEAYLPEMGWVGLDPTIGELTSSDHVVVGVSNHPRGVMPVSGAFFGARADFLEMKVRVQTERGVDGAAIAPLRL